MRSCVVVVAEVEIQTYRLCRTNKDYERSNGVKSMGLFCVPLTVGSQPLTFFLHLASLPFTTHTLFLVFAHLFSLSLSPNKHSSSSSSRCSPPPHLCILVILFSFPLFSLSVLTCIALFPLLHQITLLHSRLHRIVHTPYFAKAKAKKSSPPPLASRNTSTHHVEDPCRQVSTAPRGALHRPPERTRSGKFLARHNRGNGHL